MPPSGVVPRLTASTGQREESMRKFQDPHTTANGETRAAVPFSELDTVWFNTGSLCNLACGSCYMESSPTDDRLAYLTADDVRLFLDEIAARGLPTAEVGFTGGEPFMNPHIEELLGTALDRGFRVLVLTNAMQPMQRPRLERSLLALREAHGSKLTLRVSLDHYTREAHESERGRGSWPIVCRGIRWLAEHGFRLHVAGRRKWDEDPEDARRGYARRFASEGIPVEAEDPEELVLFPEMDLAVPVPEITTGCWEVLGVDPSDLMCASSRMVLRRKDRSQPSVVACTLLAYDRRFELGASLREAEAAVPLNHPYCAQFCVLGGGSCSAPAATGSSPRGS